MHNRLTWTGLISPVRQRCVFVFALVNGQVNAAIHRLSNTSHARAYWAHLYMSHDRSVTSKRMTPYCFLSLTENTNLMFYWLPCN